MGLLLDEFGPAPKRTGATADGGHDGVPAVEQLVSLVTPRVEQFRAASQGLRDLSTAATNTGFGCLRRIDVLDVRRGELVDVPVRISVEQPVRIDPPHKLDVLLGHRLLSEVHGFEGRLPVRESLAANNPAVQHGPYGPDVPLIPAPLCFPRPRQVAEMNT
jgi:hypothetical protein